MKFFPGDHFEVAGGGGITRKGYVHAIEYAPNGDKYIVEWENYPSQRFDYLVQDVEHDWIKSVDMFTARNSTKTLEGNLVVNNKTVNSTIIGGNTTINLPHGISVDMDKIGCNHSWKEYLGFNDSFTFCTKCDKRK